MERLHASYKDKGLVTLGISLDDEEEWEDVRKFAAEHGISYPVLKGNEDVSEKFLVRVIPTVYLVNREGIIAKQYVGGGIDEALEKEIRALL
jgi:peroxiredoxin